MDVHPIHPLSFIHLSTTPPLNDTHLYPFPSDPLLSDPLHDQALSDQNFLEHLPHPDDDILDKMIAASFDDPIPNPPLMEQIDLMLTPACPPPNNHSHLQTTTRKKRGIQKEKRTRAPARPWTQAEHQRFEQSLELFGRDWEQCAAYIGTRRPQLVRSHAQKHLIKLWKLGKPLPKKVAESGTGYTLSGKPLLADSASARSYLTKIPCPNSF